MKTHYGTTVPESYQLLRRKDTRELYYVVHLEAHRDALWIARVGSIRAMLYEMEDVEMLYDKVPMA
jgi:hypothetical protein